MTIIYCNREDCPSNKERLCSATSVQMRKKEFDTYVKKFDDNELINCMVCSADYLRQENPTDKGLIEE